MTKTCPHCNGTNTSEIIYGLPAPEFLLKPKKEKKNVVHGGTYNSSVINTVAALKTIKEIEKKKIFIKVKSKIIDKGRPKNIEAIFKAIKYLY